MTTMGARSGVGQLGGGAGDTGQGITVAMVLAAGLGTRMRGLTADRPKPMVMLAGRPMIDHVLDRLVAAGIRRVVVNVHYRADVLESHLAGRSAPEILISDERHALLETGGGVLRALPVLGPDPFLVHNSDAVWVEGPISNIARLIAAWDDARMDALMLLAPTTSSLGYDGSGDFAMAHDGRLRFRTEREVVPFVFAGVSIAHPRMFDGLEPSAFSLSRLWRKAAAAGRLYGIRHDGLWMHVGTPEALTEAEEVFTRGRL